MSTSTGRFLSPIHRQPKDRNVKEHRPTVRELNKINRKLATQIRRETKKRAKIAELLFFRDDLAQKLYDLRTAPIKPAPRQEAMSMDDLRRINTP